MAYGQAQADYLNRLGGNAPTPPPPQTQTMGPPAPTGGTPPPPTSMNPAPGPYSPYGNNPQPVQRPGMMPPPPMPGMPSAKPVNAGPAPSPRTGGAEWEGWNPEAINQYGGQQIAGATPSEADYGSVQGYADQAYDQAMKRIEPQQAAQDRRFEQEMINKGIDPQSAMGQQMADDLSRQQADQMNSATFGALQFGQGIQNQMSQQELANQNIAAGMQQGLWGNQLGASGQDLAWNKGLMDNALGWGNMQSQHALANAQMKNQYNLGMGQLGAGMYGDQLGYASNINNANASMYGADLGHQLGMGNLDLARQGQNFGEMQQLWENQYDTKSYNDQMEMLRMAMINQNVGGQMPNWGQVDPNSPYGSDRGTPSGGWNVGFSGQ